MIHCFQTIHTENMSSHLEENVAVEMGLDLPISPQGKNHEKECVAWTLPLTFSRSVLRVMIPTEDFLTGDRFVVVKLTWIE